MSKSSVDISVIYKWPYDAYEQGDVAMAAVGAGVMWWWIGGSPLQGQDSMLLLQGYLAGGAAVYAYEMMTSKAGGAKKSEY